MSAVGVELTVQVHLPFSIREGQNGTPDHYCHSIVNQAPKQLGFISDIGSRANSSFSVVRTYVCECMCVHCIE